MKSNSHKKIVVIVAIILLLTVTVGGTLAYLGVVTPTLTNVFQSTQVSCAVVENGTSYTANTVNGVTGKSDVVIKNTSDVDAYIRAMVVVTWKSSDGAVYATKPALGTHYTMTIGEDWSNSDGIYYYKSSVAADASTGALIESATKLVDQFESADGTVYNLSIEIVAEAIQAQGMDADGAVDAWAKAKSGS